MRRDQAFLAHASHATQQINRDYCETITGREAQKTNIPKATPNMIGTVKTAP